MAVDRHAERRARRRGELLESLELPFLAIAAIATAWSGYQAAKGDGRQTLLYGQASPTGSRPRPPRPAAGRS